MTLFHLILKQLAIVGVILASLPLVITLLWKLRLMPLAVTLFLPVLMGREWALAHQTLLLGLLAASVLFAVLAWVLWFRRRKQEQRYYETILLANAIPMYHINEQGEYILNVDL